MFPVWMSARAGRAVVAVLAVSLGVAVMAGCDDSGDSAVPLVRTARVERGSVGPARQVKVVPTAAVTKQGGQSLVTVPGPDGRPLRIPFEPGAVGDDLTEVRSGLAEGQIVILPAPPAG